MSTFASATTRLAGASWAVKVHCGIALLPVEADVVMLAGFTASNRAIAASVAGWQAMADAELAALAPVVCACL